MYLPNLLILYFLVQNCNADSTANLTLSWSLRHSPCWQEYIGLETVVSYSCISYLSIKN